MDAGKARHLDRTLTGTEICNFKILGLIGHGKSGAVFKAIKDDLIYAVKIFDNEIVERFGHEIQQDRIKKEISLSGHKINGLVRIHSGGRTFEDKHYYLVMDFIEGKNLKEYIETEDYDEPDIIKIVQSLHRTTEELISEYKIAHRDIKPENIIIKTCGNPVLMDLGILKVVGNQSLTDNEEKEFIGTLRYAAPEFLLREEGDDMDSWRAINLYQIGATLHDLIMQKELFKEKSPYTNLVIAIKSDTPEISSNSISFKLQKLAIDLLTKSPQKRLNLFKNSRINELIASVGSNPYEDGIDEILKMTLSNKAQSTKLDELRKSRNEIKKSQNDFSERLVQIFDNVFDEFKERGIFVSYEKSDTFLLNSDMHRFNNKSIIKNRLYKLIGNLDNGFSGSLFIFIRLTNDEDNYSEVEIFGLLPPIMDTRTALTKPENFIAEATKSINQNYMKKTDVSYNFIPKFIKVYEGHAILGKPFQNEIAAYIIKLLTICLAKMAPEVKKRYQKDEDALKSGSGFYFHESSSSPGEIIDNLDQ